MHGTAEKGCGKRVAVCIWLIDAALSGRPICAAGGSPNIQLCRPPQKKRKTRIIRTETNSGLIGRSQTANTRLIET
jgi:hypothetical protein